MSPERSSIAISQSMAFHAAVLIVFFSVLQLALATSTAAETYTMFTVPGALSLNNTIINAPGVITGTFTDSKEVGHGFVRAVDGTITVFDPAGSIGTDVSGVENDGVVVGDYQLADFSIHGFIRATDGTITTFDPPESRDTFVDAVAHGIMGAYETPKVVHGFVRSKRGVYDIFEYPGVRDTEPHAINRSGTIVGIYRIHQFKTHGFVRYPDGTFETLLSHGATWPVAINDDGVIVGSDSHDRMFVRAADGMITTVEVTDALIEPVGVNAKGTVAGIYHDVNDMERGLIWTPEQGVVLFDVPGATATIPSSIDNKGVITGTCIVSDGHGGQAAAGFIRTP